ncbi:MAG TPA: S8 family serine peptidase [Phycisphaerae bacterium]|nr:S8 family serine peptidase [Phycisphaerae bacterium]
MSRPWWLLLVCVAVSVWPATSTAEPLTPRPEVVKPAHTDVDGAFFRTDVIAVKFRDGLAVRLRGDALTGVEGLAGVDGALADVADGRWEPAHSLEEGKLDGLRQTAEANLGRAVADLNLQFHLFLPEGADPAATIDAFNALDAIEIALPIPKPMAPPVPPNYEFSQGYLNAATAGVDARCMWQVFGGTGTNINIADLEYSWNLSHQDLSSTTLLGATPNDPFSDDNHGTAVLGEVGSLRNSWGTTGVAYGSTMYVVATNTGPGAGVWDIGAAITTALGTLGAGDVILIEQQMAGPNYTGIPSGTQFGLIPVEWYQPWYNTIVTAVGNSVTVVEAAGNGSQNLDDAIYSTGNGGHWPFLPANDSGAIIVGAGASPGGSDVDRSRLSFSNYGSTVDLQGWGENVYTTGYGGAYSAEGKNLWYTATFGGTSSASPIVAGACVVLQSAYVATMAGPLTPAQVKANLQGTGSPQQSGTFPSTQNIGPRPDAAAAASLSMPVIDSNGNLIPDVCEALVGLEACCLANNGCADALPAACTANSGTPQGPGTTCATSGCAATEACCFPGPAPLCADMLPMNCQMAAGFPQGPGTNCTTTQCRAMVPKFSQPPTQDREDIASNIDLLNMVPNVVLADDFQSDGRPITVVRWWGSYLDQHYAPVAHGGMPSPYEIDGWLISFHEPLVSDPNGPQQPPLGLYFARVADVTITPTVIPSCDGHPVFEYAVEIVKCCLLQSFPDSRSGWLPAQPEAFEEEHCFLYDIDIQAVVGMSYQRDPQGWCLQVASPNIGEGTDFWGWHSTDIENGRRNALTTTVTTDAVAVWLYGPWVDALPVCAPAPVNMAFELLTDDPKVPPPCPEACCYPDGSCVDLLPSNCTTNGGTAQGMGTSCATTVCSNPEVFRFEFSLDIGSDREMSDPNMDGDEGFDPGDVYWWQGPPVTPPWVPGGRDGFKDDEFIFGFDPWPDAPDPATRVPVGGVTNPPDPEVWYDQYFDLDGHDQIDFSLQGLVPPDEPLDQAIGWFPTHCVHGVEFLMVSYDDDMAPGWLNVDVPVTTPSPAGVSCYGTTGARDEVRGVTVIPGPPPLPIINMYPIADEDSVHLSLVPNPNNGAETCDDDVDSLDVVPDDLACPVWLFSADHEANLGLDPGGIYEVFAGSPVQVIDEAIHLGLPEETDIDAFELAWLEDPNAGAAPVLALLFSVDEDDPLTPGDESGGMDPRMIFASFLTGYSFPALAAPLEDDVDALTLWLMELPEQPWLIGALSCRYHAGIRYCLDLLANNAEPRLGGVQELDLAFDRPVTTLTASVQCASGYTGTGTVVTLLPDIQATVQFTPWPDQDCCTVFLEGDLTDALAVTVLIGDVNFDGAISTADGSSVKQRLGQLATPSNFWYDVNMDGSISTADRSSIKQRLGNVAPLCPDCP